MKRLGIVLFVCSVVGCGSSRSGSSGPSGAARRDCVVGAFVEAFSDDGHGVMVTLAQPRNSAQRYEAGAATGQFYVHDKGSPTYGLAKDAEVWLVQNEPADVFQWLLISSESAKQRCPARLP